MPQHYELAAQPTTVHWGFFDASLPPVLTVDSGDTITFHTVSGGPTVLHPDPRRVPPELLEIHANCSRGEGGHIMVGPVFVRGAEPGDVLEVHIRDIQLRMDWGYNSFRPLSGTLPDDFPRQRLVHIEIDRARRTADWGAGVTVPLQPFFGNMGVAPPPELGRISTNPPGVHGGNLDNKELGAGSILYLPVWNSGGLLSVGDGHAVQGDGEVNLTAIETGLSGTVELRVRKGASLRLPRAETSTHHITMGFDPDLDQAAKIALREMLHFLHTTFGLSLDDAYTLASLAVDLHVTQLVNGYKGIHAMVAKSLFST
ncbi:MAG: acetamidase/formamidase family protein [Candidatus Tectomicrobia bacterium]|nr:acetamidase/formamidase family protein [Candidatus Tectomicrobia bacterium]